VEEDSSPYAVQVAPEPTYQVLQIDGKNHMLPEKSVKINFLERVVRSVLFLFVCFYFFLSFFWTLFFFL